MITKRKKKVSKAAEKRRAAREKKAREFAAKHKEDVFVPPVVWRPSGQLDIKSKNNGLTPRSLSAEEIMAKAKADRGDH